MRQHTQPPSPPNQHDRQDPLPLHRLLALILHTQAQKAADEARARAQMEAALGGGGVGGGDGASWGLMGPDAEWEEGAGPSGEGLDWRLHMEKQTLTDKQMKLVDKIRWVL